MQDRVRFEVGEAAHCAPGGAFDAVFFFEALHDMGDPDAAIRQAAANLADDGVMKIVKPGPELEVIAENPLGEYCYASPAIADGKLYIRGEKHLYCIGK